MGVSATALSRGALGSGIPSLRILLCRRKWRPTRGLCPLLLTLQRRPRQCLKTRVAVEGGDVEEAPEASEPEMQLLQSMGLHEIEQALRAVLGPLAEAAPAASEPAVSSAASDPAVSSPDAQTLPLPRWVTAATLGGTASVEERGGQRHQYGPWRSKRQWERVIKNKHRKRGRK